MAEQNLNKVLFVDDEPNILLGLKRQLRTTFKVYTAHSGAEGLSVIKENGPFPVVVSDMRMPEMNGAVFLTKVKEVAPTTMRVLLTGHTDIDAAMSAINDGEIFRFLLKPCSQELMLRALNAAIDHNRLLKVEKELLEKTLQGSIKVLTDILSLVNPLAFSRSSKIRTYVKHIVGRLGVSGAWQYELAAMLSQIGCVTVPSEILAKVYAGQALSSEEQVLFDSHPGIGHDLISKIPRLTMVAKIIQQQRDVHADLAAQPISELKPDVLGGQILNIALDLDNKVTSGQSLKSVVSEMQGNPDQYHPALIALLDDLKDDTSAETRKMISAGELTSSMMIDEDVLSTSGSLIVSKGQEVTDAMLARLQMMSRNETLQEPFRVVVR